jgi:threonine/homoserine/homoserine lactone efflux protein
VTSVASRAGLLNVAGTQLGLGVMMAILTVGLSSVIAAPALSCQENASGWFRALAAAS